MHGWPDTICTKTFLQLAVCLCFPCSLKLTVSCHVSTGLAKRVGARLLLASTSEVYGGEWVSLCPPGQQAPVTAGGKRDQ